MTLPFAGRVAVRPPLFFNELQRTTAGAVAAPDRPLGAVGHAALWAHLGSGLYLIVVGAWFVPALSIGQAVLATALGAVLGGALVAAAVHLGASANRPAVVLYRGALGESGARLYGSLAVFRHLAWGTIQVAIAAELLAAVAVRGGLEASRGAWAAMLGGLLLFLLALGPTTVLRRWLVPSALLVVGIAAAMTYSAWADYGVASLLKRGPSGGWPGFTGVVDLAAALAVLWLPVASDLGRLGRSDRAGPAAFFGLAGMTTWFVLVGVLFVPAVSGDDLAGFLLATPLGLLAVLLVVVLELDGAFVSLYALVSTVRGWLPNTNASGETAVAGAAGFALGGALLNPFDHGDALLLLGAAFVPLLGVLLGARLARRFIGAVRVPIARSVLAWGIGFLLYNWASPLQVPGWTDALARFFEGVLRLPFPAGAPGLSATVLSFVAAFVLAGAPAARRGGAAAGRTVWRAVARRRRRFALDPRLPLIVAVMAALFVSALSQTIVATALPRIVGDLGGLALYSWVLTSSMVAMTAVTPLVGKLSDRYGRKPFLMGGIVLFMAASALTGAAQNMVQLIVFRAVQGVAAGTIQASAFAAVGDLFPPAERGKYFGLFTGAFAVASVMGPVLGGLVTDHWGWRWVFYLTIPFGLVALLVLMGGMPWQRLGERDQPIDWLGMGALLWAVVPLLLALSWGNDRFGWSSWQVAALIAVFVLGTGAFVAVERQARDPVLPLGLFGNRTFLVGAMVAFLTGTGLFGALSYMPLFIQGALGASATNSGLVNTPLMLGLTAASLTAGAVSSRTGRYRWLVVAGGVVLAAGMAVMAALDEQSSLALPIVGMVVVGLGLGLSMPLLSLAVQNALAAGQLGVATASTNFFRQIGGTLGIAVFGTVLSARLHDDLLARLPREVTSVAPEETLRRLEEPRILLSPETLAAMRSGFDAFGASGAQLYHATLAAMRSVLADGLHDVFLVGLLVAVLAAVVSVLLPELPLRGVEGALEAQTPAGAGDLLSLDEGRALYDVLAYGELYHGRPPAVGELGEHERERAAAGG